MARNISVYGFQTGNKAIYGMNSQGSMSITGGLGTGGIGPGSGSGSGSGPSGPSGPGSSDCTDTVALNQLLTLVNKLYEIIEVSFPSAKAMADLIAAFTAPARMNPFTYVRFAWIKANPGQKLYPSVSSALAIKDLYLANGLDWTADPLILMFLSS